MSAPAGNQNAAKAKVWSAAIGRALDKRGKSRIEALDDLAEKFLKRCDEGDLMAFKELGDRLEGKPPIHATLAGDETAPLFIDRAADLLEKIRG